MSAGPILGPTGLPLVGGGGLPRVGDPATEDCCCGGTPDCAICTTLPATIAVTIAGFADQPNPPYTPPQTYSAFNGSWSAAYVTGCDFVASKTLSVDPLGSASYSVLARLLGETPGGTAHWLVTLYLTSNNSIVFGTWSPSTTAIVTPICEGGGPYPVNLSPSPAYATVPTASYSSSTATVSL